MESACLGSFCLLYLVGLSQELKVYFLLCLRISVQFFWVYIIEYRDIFCIFIHSPNFSISLSLWKMSTSKCFSNSFFLVLHLSVHSCTASYQTAYFQLNWFRYIYGLKKKIPQTFYSYGEARNSFLLQQLLMHIYWIASLRMLWWACLSVKMTWSSLRSQYLWFQLGV